MEHQAEDCEELAVERKGNELEKGLEKNLEKKTSMVDTDLKELELEVAVRYCVEYVKQEAFGMCTKDQLEQDDLLIEEINEEIHNLDGIETEEEDENNWKDVEAKQRRIKQKVLQWLISEKHI